MLTELKFDGWLPILDIDIVYPLFISVSVITGAAFALIAGAAELNLKPTLGLVTILGLTFIP